MEIIKIENLSFAYPNKNKKALDDINIGISKGEFVTVCGKSGCGKTTLLRLLKSCLSPHGTLSGTVFFEGVPLKKIDAKTQAEKIGFVMQSPENQIVTDKVWHELAFGLESLSFSTPEIRARVSEMAAFFGIESWFYKNVSELSGGQKQLLNLASVMVMQPSVLVLDEPTSQLDPIAAGEFLKTLEKINRELGVTVILSEHRLEEAFPMSDRVIVMDEAKIVADDTPKKVGELLKEKNHDMRHALPAPMRIFGGVKCDLPCPVTVREGRQWLEEITKKITPDMTAVPAPKAREKQEIVIELSDVWFRYEKNLLDVVKGLSMNVSKGELYAIVGGNGAGKSTSLSLMAGLNKPYRGEVYIKGKKLSKCDDLYNRTIGVLPQNPQSVFVKKTVYLDLLDILSDSKLSDEQKENRVHEMACLCGISSLLTSHPYDLSGGEQQRAALCKVLLRSPEILLLDEPTKGLDSYYKKDLADILKNLTARGVTIVMVSHDIEFCAEYADRCALFFDGTITSVGDPREFFCGKSFYTTSANRMARTTVPQAVLADDVILALGGECEKREKKNIENFPDDLYGKNDDISQSKKTAKRKNAPKIAASIFFAIVFAATFVLRISGAFSTELGKISLLGFDLLQISSVVSAALCIILLFPSTKLDLAQARIQKGDRKLAKRTLVATLLILVAIPLTIFIGIKFFGDRKYYFISLLMIFETMLPFCMVFESRKPKARELVVISVLCALAVAGRTAFFALPQFKPVIALVIISGVCFGGETGFLVGAVTGFISNFFFGQGPWTPWQMFAFGIIGFLAGILFSKGVLYRSKLSLCIFGFFATIVIFGGIMNPASVILAQNKITFEMLLSSYAVGAPFDIIHALSTSFFLWFISEPMIEKLERIKVKYGMITEQT